MTGSKYRLKPLQKTQSIPIHWEFTQDDYDKLVKGHRSNWCIFLRDDIVHVCRVGGEEFYRFGMSKASDGLYIADNLEMYAYDDYYKSERRHGCSGEKIEQYKVELKESATDEIVGLLVSFFSIRIA